MSGPSRLAVYNVLTALPKSRKARVPSITQAARSGFANGDDSTIRLTSSRSATERMLSWANLRSAHSLRRPFTPPDENARVPYLQHGFNFVHPEFQDVSSEMEPSGRGFGFLGSASFTA